MAGSRAWILAVVALATGCAGPIETRVQTHQPVSPPDQKSFMLSASDVVQNQALQMARQQVAEALGKKGYTATANAPILVHVALSDRPADIAIVATDKSGEQSLAAAKDRKRFQSCKDREHRLTISLFDQVRATQSYTGSASEYHCKGTIAQSLPHLIKHALAGLDSDLRDSPQTAVHTRQGIE